MNWSKTINNQLNANVGLWNGEKEKNIYRGEKFKW